MINPVGTLYFLIIPGLFIACYAGLMMAIGLNDEDRAVAMMIRGKLAR